MEVWCETLSPTGLVEAAVSGFSGQAASLVSPAVRTSGLLKHITEAMTKTFA